LGAEGWIVIHGGAPDFLCIKLDKDDNIEAVAFREVKSGVDVIKFEQFQWGRALQFLGADYDVVSIKTFQKPDLPPKSTEVFSFSANLENIHTLDILYKIGSREGWTKGEVIMDAIRDYVRVNEKILVQTKLDDHI